MYYKRLQQKALRKLRAKAKTPLDSRVKSACMAAACLFIQELVMEMYGLEGPVLRRIVQKLIDENHRRDGKT